MAWSAPPRRIAALDWAGCEILVALGIEPVAVADVRGFSGQFPHCALPLATVDLGARWEPNLELLMQLVPDAIIVGSRGIFPAAERIAPPLVLQLYDGKTPPLAAAMRSFQEFGEILSLEPRAERYASQVQSSFETAHRRFAAYSKPVLVATLEPDGLNVVVHGRNGLIGNCLEKVGLQNAWDEEENSWGFRKTGLEQLLRFPDALILIIDQGIRTDRALSTLAGNDIWQMILNNIGSVVRIPAIFPFGALPTAQYFVRSLLTFIV